MLTPVGTNASQVIAWGAGTTNSGQYPDLGQSIVPGNLTNAVALAGGETFSLALRNDGTVIAWGDDSAGQTDVPSDLSNVVAIAAGYAHALALKADGTVVAWGANGSQQTNVPLELTNAVSIAAGQYHSLALRRDGTVTAWGDDTAHQTEVPVGLSNVVAIAAGRAHCVALISDGTVRAWGDNSSGQCNPPMGLRNVTAIAAGDSYSLALKTSRPVVSGNQLNPPSGTNSTIVFSAVAWGSQTNIPATLALPPAAIISINPGTTDNSVTKYAGQTGNVVINGSTLGPLIVDCGAGFAVLANGRVNYNTNYLNPPASAYSMTNWGTANQVPDYTSQGTPNTLYDFNRFLAVANATPSGYAPSGNNRFTNLATFMTAAIAHTPTNPMEGVVAVDLRSNDKNLGNLTDRTIPNGINVKGTMLFNFTGTGWDPVSERVVVTTAININAANLSHLVATNPATYTSGYPPVYTDPTKNPININIAPAYQNFTPGEDLPAELNTIGCLDIHGSLNICGAVYTPSFMEIENKAANGATQYIRGCLITGLGAYLENTYTNSVSIFSYDPRPSAIELAARGSHNLALRSNGSLFSWGDQSVSPPGLANVAEIAAGVWHNLALVGGNLRRSSVLLTNIPRSANGFTVSLPTSSGRIYALEYKNLLTDAHWTALPLVAGNGGDLTLTDPDNSSPQRFYRVRQW